MKSHGQLYFESNLRFYNYFLLSILIPIFSVKLKLQTFFLL